MKVFSTSYFPSVHYLNQIRKAGELTVDLGEHFIKQTHRNRCVILGANGRLNLIVPLKKWRNNTPVRDIRISYAENWQKLHWRSLESAYRSSPYFEYYEAKLRGLLLDQKLEFLADLNKACLQFAMQSLNIDASIHYSNEYRTVENEMDFRNMDFLSSHAEDAAMSYIQVFNAGSSFEANLSCLDLICNEGPNGINLLT